MKTGTKFALSAALLGGFLIFLGQSAFLIFVDDIFVLAVLSGLFASLVLSLTVISPLVADQLGKIGRKGWFNLLLLGLVGGGSGLAFLRAIDLSGTTEQGVMMGSILVWLTTLLLIFLKRSSRKKTFFNYSVFLSAGGVLFTLWGSDFSLSYFLFFIAALLLAWEFLLVKNILKSVEPEVAAWAKMFFGSLVLLSYAFFTGKAELFLYVNYSQWSWVILTGVFLLIFVWSWYQAINNLSISSTAKILFLLCPVGIILSQCFVQKEYWLSLVLLILVLTVGYGYYFLNKRSMARKNWQTQKKY
ncbi:MAG TPA: EamA family transporter [Patescibacteria group bacterium]|nr:EamA family transporter [Patescibacteria group bacterium]